MDVTGWIWLVSGCLSGSKRCGAEELLVDSSSQVAASLREVANVPNTEESDLPKVEIWEASSTSLPSKPQSVTGRPDLIASF